MSAFNRKQIYLIGVIFSAITFFIALDGFPDHADESTHFLDQTSSSRVPKSINAKISKESGLN